MVKGKERILKAERKRKGDSSLQRSSIRLSADFSKETLRAGRVWKEVLEVMKDKDLHPR